MERFLGRGWYTRSTDGALRGHRNSYEPKRVHLAEGTIELQVPQLRETMEPFESIWLRAIGTRSSRLLQMIPMLYVKGMSQRDIEAALIDALGVEGTGRSVITEVCRSLRGDLARWQERDLSEHRLCCTCSSTGSTSGCTLTRSAPWRCCAPTGSSGTARRCCCT